MVEIGIKATSRSQFSTYLEIFPHMESTEISAQTRKTKKKYIHINIHTHFHKT